VRDLEVQRMSRRIAVLLTLSCAVIALCASSAWGRWGRISVTKVGSGYVSSGDGAIDCGATCSALVPYECDTSGFKPVCFPALVDLTAADANGFTLDHWDGCLTESGSDCSAEANGTTVTAYFRDVQDPTVMLTSPAAGPHRGVLSLQASASDNAGVAAVRYYLNGVQVTTASSPPYFASVDTSSFADGPALVEARAQDTSNRLSASSGQMITIDNTAPSVSITSGPNGQTFNPGTTQTWAFSASDATSGVQSVQCSVDGGAFGACSGGSTSHGVTGAASGPHTFTVRATDVAGNVADTSRSWTIRTPPANTAAPLVQGATMQVSATITATTGSWRGNPTSYSYGFQRCDSAGANCTAIGTTDATDDASYRLTSADFGHRIRVEVTATNAGGSTAADSAPGAIVGLPRASAAPAITGVMQIGERLVASTGKWVGNPTSYKYTWLRCDSTGTTCSPITGTDATDGDYTLTSADYGHRLRVRVSATNAAGTASTQSNATPIVGLPVATTLPAISGTAVAGSVLTATTGTWSGSPTTFKFAWLRCDAAGAGCVAIGTADATDDSDYTPVAADIGHAIVVRVTATNSAGPQPANSAPTSSVGA
jgi:hypothetical protein